MSWLRATGLRLILAIGLGFALWVFVSYTENPDRAVQFKDRQVVFEGLGPGLVIVDQNGMPNPPLSLVTVTLEADRETLAAPGNSDIQTYVDLQGLGPADHVVPVGARITLPGRQPDVVNISPAFLSIRIEDVITRTVPLTIELSGGVPFSFEKGVAEATVAEQPITQTLVTGPRSRVLRVVATQATADINGLTANYNSSRQLEAVAEDGQVIEGVTIVPPMVHVQVPIISTVGIKRVPVVPRVVGRPAGGYIVTSVSIQPQFVRLTGSSGPLDGVQSIETQDIDVSGVDESFTRVVGLQPLPFSGISYGEAISATVTVQVALIERAFQVMLPVAVQVVDVGGGLLGSVSPPVVQVTLEGSAARLGSLGATIVSATVSAQGLGSGVYTVAPTFVVPPGLVIVGSPPMVTLSLHVSVVPTDVPSPTPLGDMPVPAATAVPTPAMTASSLP